MVFVPFLGDFFSIVVRSSEEKLPTGFRPLSRGLFFNTEIRTSGNRRQFSSPFSGTFFQFDIVHECYQMQKFSSPFSGTFFQ